MNRLAKVSPYAAARSEQTRSKEAAPENSSSPPAAQSPDSRERLLLSVGEAAARLGIDKAHLRIVLSHGQVSHKLVAKRADAPFAEAGQELQAGTLPNQPERGKGVRVPVDILDDLRLLLESLAPESPIFPSEVEARSALPVPLEELAAPDAALSVVAEPLQIEGIESGESLDGGYGESIQESQPEPYAAAEMDFPSEGEAQHSPLAASSMPLTLAFERLLGEKDARIDDLKAEIAHLRNVLEREQHSHARAQALLSLQSPLSSEALTKPIAETITADNSASAAGTPQPNLTTSPAQQSIWRGIFSRLRAR